MTEPRQEDDLNVPLRLQPVVARPEGWRGGARTALSPSASSASWRSVSCLGRPSTTAAHRASRPLASASPWPASNSPPPSRTSNADTRRLATRLPAREILGGAIPTERRLVYANGMQVLDLATGTLTSPTQPFRGPAPAARRRPALCARAWCATPRLVAIPAPHPILRFGRFDLAGKPIVERGL